MENYKNYINKFANAQELQAALDSGDLKKPYVALIEDQNVIDYDSEDRKDYFTITNLTNQEGHITIDNSMGANSLRVRTSVDKINWMETVVPTSNQTASLVIPANGHLYFDGANITSWGVGSWSGARITGDVEHSVSGDLMTLISGDTMPNYAFNVLFAGNTGLTSASALTMPATLSNYCFQGMFNGCTNLEDAPALPATTLAVSCYGSMFQNCTSLQIAPELPATTLADGCYGAMFQGCTSLTDTPELPATTLAQSCYSGMFSGCTMITTAPELPATTLAVSCYSFMFYGCTSLTSAPDLPATDVYGENGRLSAYSNMFADCVSLTTAPEISATTVGRADFNGMFSGCTSLVTGPTIRVTEATVGDPFAGMFDNCTALTSFTCYLVSATPTPIPMRFFQYISYSAGTLYCPAGSESIWTPGTNLPSNWTVANIS